MSELVRVVMLLSISLFSNLCEELPVRTTETTDGNLNHTLHHDYNTVPKTRTTETRKCHHYKLKSRPILMYDEDDHYFRYINKWPPIKTLTSKGDKSREAAAAAAGAEENGRNIYYATGTTAASPEKSRRSNQKTGWVESDRENRINRRILAVESLLEKSDGHGENYPASSTETADHYVNKIMNRILKRTRPLHSRPIRQQQEDIADDDDDIDDDNFGEDIAIENEDAPEEEPTSTTEVLSEKSDIEVQQNQEKLRHKNLTAESEDIGDGASVTEMHSTSLGTSHFDEFGLLLILVYSFLMNL